MCRTTTYPPVFFCNNIIIIFIIYNNTILCLIEPSLLPSPPKHKGSGTFGPEWRGVCGGDVWCWSRCGMSVEWEVHMWEGRSDFRWISQLTPDWMNHNTLCDNRSTAGLSQSCIVIAVWKLGSLATEYDVTINMWIVEGGALGWAVQRPLHCSQAYDSGTEWRQGNRRCVLWTY